MRLLTACDPTHLDPPADALHSSGPLGFSGTGEPLASKFWGSPARATEPRQGQRSATLTEHPNVILSTGPRLPLGLRG